MSFLERVSLESLVERYGSPLYIYDAATIRTQYRALRSSFSAIPLEIHYAMKANSNPSILKLLLEEGASIDAVSPFEVRLALEVGFAPKSILFTGNNVHRQELESCIQQQISVNVESLQALELYGQLCPGGEVSIRINPGVGAGHHGHCITGGPQSKFGIYFDQLHEIFRIQKHYQLMITGIHSHIGTGILEKAPMMEALELVLSVAQQFKNLRFIDIGGGFGIPYYPDQQSLDLQELGQELTDRFLQFCESYGSRLILKVEPGRFLVGNSGVLIAEVTSKKHTPYYQFVGINSGFNHLIRPAFYGSFHRIENRSNLKGVLEPVILAGNICETGDIFTQDEQGPATQLLAETRIGDLIAIHDVGAYGMAMSSQYNLRPRPAEILLDGDSFQLIRRAETYEEVIRMYPSFTP